MARQVSLAISRLAIRQGGSRRVGLPVPLTSAQGKDLEPCAGVDGSGPCLRGAKPMAAVIALVPQTVVPASKAVAPHEMGTGEEPSRPPHASVRLLTGPTPAAPPIGVVALGLSGPPCAIFQDTA